MLSSIPVRLNPDHNRFLMSLGLMSFPTRHPSGPTNYAPFAIPSPHNFLQQCISFACVLVDASGKWDFLSRHTSWHDHVTGQCSANIVFNVPTKLASLFNYFVELFLRFADRIGFPVRHGEQTVVQQLSSDAADWLSTIGRNWWLQYVLGKTFIECRSFLMVFRFVPVASRSLVWFCRAI